MGIFSSIGKIAKGAVNLVAGGVIDFVKKPSLAKAPAAALDVATTFIPVGKVVKPAAIVAKPVVKVATPVVTKTLPKVLGAVVKGVGSVAKSIIPKTTKGKIIGAGAAVVGAGLISSAPKETATAIAKTPSSLFNVGSNLGTLVKEPSAQNAKTLFTENPLIVGGAVAAGAFALGKSLLPAIATTRQTSAINEQTQALENLTSFPAAAEPTPDGTIKVAYPNNQISPVTPVTPQTTTSTGTKALRKYRRKAQKPSIMQQKVNVMVNNSTRTIGVRNSYQNKNYIKRELYN